MTLSNTFKELKTIIQPYEKYCTCSRNESDAFLLSTEHIMKNGKPLFFGAVNLKKNYVSFHLMPVYVNPELLLDISEKLKKRMQGKSCFNFKTIDDELFTELSELTEVGYQYYKKEEFI